MCICESIPAPESMGSGWAHSRACLIPLSLPFLSFVSPFTSSWPWSCAQTGGASSSSSGGHRILLPYSFFGSQFGKVSLLPRIRGHLGPLDIFFPFHHSHRSRRQAQKEKRVHLDAGTARRSARRNPCCDLWCMNLCLQGCGRQGWMRMGPQVGWKGGARQTGPRRMCM